MSVDTTRKTINAYIDSLLHGGDFASFFSDDVLWTTMETGEQVRGRDAVRDYIVALHTQAFTASPEVKRFVAADDVAVLEAVFVGTHVAEFAGVPATGKQVRLPYAVVYDLSGDTITALNAYFPVNALANQLRSAAPTG
ncbi:conserved hypothetical protein, steroid delta-isomerase-related [Pedococcus cremeus]|uniref:Uncharacterized protein n=1 Tax=Pedococcus cremeus TaxID=587636 RepID=A0A1H9X2T1_9MICO|nr:nuclear transport factor 2 family protein [Pedococcus cremeus]SES40414.1 conserved hypothetical protein, steroid delta-isomerase-related [Pedococcus cremeus]